MEKRCLSLLLAVLTVLSLLVPVFAADDGPEVPAEASQSVEAAAPAEEAPAAVTAVSSDAEQLVEPAEETGSGSAMPGSGTDAGTSGTTGDVAWSFSDGTLRISGHGAMAEYRPDSAPEGSGQPWYVYRARIRNVVIDSGVTAVGAYAFSGCAALTSVELPDSVVRVSEGVFRDTGLRDIVVANAACAIRGDASSLGRPGVTIIHGCAGSAVQSYALAYGYQFAAIPGTGASPDKSGTAPAPEAATGTDAVPAPEDDGATSDAGVEAAAASETDAASVPDAQALPVPDAPELIGVTSAATGVTISWNSFPGAVKYRVFYKNGDGGWKKIADTTKTSYTWTKAKAGTEYTYTVRCVSKSGKSYTSNYDPVGVSYKLLATPSVTVTGGVDTVTVNWGAVSGAAKYRVFLKNGKNWETLADVAETSYTMAAASGKSYTFTVRCLDEAGNYSSGYNTKGKSIAYISTPMISGVEPAASGVTVRWGAVGGAAKYRVFYKNGDGGWKKIADTTKTSYTWTKAKAGTEYTYTVRCVSKTGKSYTSNFDPVGVSYKLLATPSVTVTGGVDTVTVSWGAVSGAAKYRVFLKNGKNWETLADVAETSYTMAAASGKSYTFTVRCLDAAGNYASGYNTKGKSIAYISTPMISGVSPAATGVTVTWGKVPGAVKYRVFYKIGNGGWKKIADTTKTSYTWTKAKAGTEYTYTVRCVSKTGKSYTSNYDPVGVSYKLLATPSVTVTGGVDTVTVSWGAVSGAAKYRVFLKTSKGWETLADVAETSYTMAAASGKSYTFTVRCLDETGDYASGYNTKGKSIAYISTPMISGVEPAASGVTVRWGAVGGAAKYRLFYKNGSGWTKIADTTKTSYTWSKAKIGTEYTFTVRCVSKTGKSYTSSYDPAGVSYKLLATPAVSVAHGTDSVTVSWGAVSGAVKYRVFLKTSKGWETLADVSGTSYTMAAASGKSYTFTVRCIDAAGNYTSGYNTAGKTITFVEQPAISGVEAASSGVTVKWGKVSGAAKYRLFYKSGSGWIKIADTTKTSYTWSGAKSGTEYTFTVRCVSSDGKSFTSAYDQTGVRFCYVAAPTLTKVANVSGGFKLTWSAVGGAAKYRIYCQMDSGAWSQLAETGQTSYTMTGADSKAKYAFAVQAVSQTGTASVRSNIWKTMVFTNSPLVAYTRISPNRDKDRKNVIDTITIHCTAELWSVEKLGESFSPVSRKASSNYGIGTDGRVGMFVEEKDCSWCSSNRDNDNRAITIEVASGTSEPYAVTDEVYAVMIDLVTDICQRNGIEKLVWSTSKNERVNHLNGCNMTVHRDYANKSCPGTYLYERMGKIAAEVNARLAS